MARVVGVAPLVQAEVVVAVLGTPLRVTTAQRIWRNVVEHSALGGGAHVIESTVIELKHHQRGCRHRHNMGMLKMKGSATRRA